ncbi:nitrilase-related carbon-nitrogen hydrolase [Gimibacter soli]|uniref:CN hydrolase domain-containing protein n=1 Tax=Gimibacter soli TaxID=3024400 RepID=A0AAF0BFS8_9PROT|nr:nitrilase-related carbon-nitrogen hydrolase [Gimibacter soli]WCL52828.1 hypothetical protein PH603_09780 [Gimibacter soli]
MILRRLLLSAAFLIAAVLAFLYWPGLPLDLDTPPELHLSVAESYGPEAGATGNVVGIEPFMETLDYATPERFEAKLRGYLDAARSRGWLGANTIVLFPEHIGTWLIAADQKPRVLKAGSTASAMVPIIAWNLPSFLKNYYLFHDADRAAAAVFRSRAGDVAAMTGEIFGRLARDYGVHIVAGSTLLMTAGIYDDDALSYGHGPLYNASFMFGPDGKPMEDAVRKIHPIPSEVGFTAKGRPDLLPVFKAAGRTVGVLVCADSWFEDATKAVADQGADLLLVPSFLTGPWDAPWGGYVNDTPESDAWRADVGRISEGEAWQKYALPAQATAHNIRWGMNVFLKGNIWELKGDGHALIVTDGALHTGSAGADTGAIYNLWLP